MDKEYIAFSIPKLHFNYKKMIINGNTRGVHIHNATEIIYSDRDFDCIIGDNVYTISSNEILIINQYIPHSIKAPNGTEISYIQIELNRYIENNSDKNRGYLYDFILQPANNFYHVFKNNGELSEIVYNMAIEIENCNYGYELYIKSYIYKLIGFLFRNSFLPDIKLIMSKDFSELSPITDYVEKNFNTKIKIDEIAKTTNYNKYTLCNHFKKVTGQTLIDFISFVRLQKAKEMLENSQKTISEIAYDCGFSSIQYFNKFFKSKVGCTPSKFKRL